MRGDHVAPTDQTIPNIRIKRSTLNSVCAGGWVGVFFYFILFFIMVAMEFIAESLTSNHTIMESTDTTFLQPSADNGQFKTIVHIVNALINQ